MNYYSSPSASGESLSSPSPREFIATITSAPPSTFIDIRCITSGGIVRPYFFYPDDARLDRIPAWANEHRLNAYFGCAWRVKPEGSAACCGGCRALWADIDFKDTPAEEAYETIKAFPLQPSVVVASGFGLHIYILLAAVLLFPSAFETARTRLRRLAVALRADAASAEPARILRIPGGLNHKYTPPKPCAILRWEPDRRYTIDEVDAALARVVDTGDLHNRSSRPRLIVPKNCMAPIDRISQIDPAALLRIKSVLKLVPVSTSSWWAGVKSGKYPPPVKLGPRTTCWRASDIFELIGRAAMETER